MLTRTSIGCLALALAAAGTAHAQVVYEPSFDPDQFTVAADPGSVGLLEGGRPLERGEFGLGLILRLGGPPLEACVRAEDGVCMVEGDVVSTRFTADMVAAFGFGRFDLRAILPIVLHQGTDFGPAEGSESLASAGFGDLRLGGKVRLATLREVVLAYDASFNIPWSGGANFIGDEGLVLDQRLLADWRWNRIAAVAGFGYRWRQEAAQLGNLYVDDELLWSVAGEYQIQPDKLSAGLALFGRIGLMSDPDPLEGMSASPSSEERPAELLASARYWLSEKIALESGLGTGLSSGYGAPNFRFLVGARYVERRPRSAGPLVTDRDGDGIADSDDRCPNEPEDFDGFQDEDGCPDPDNDGDGIPDTLDRCPNEPEDQNGFQDDDGCPDATADSDNDGIPDATDQCPNEAEDLDGFQDDDGCPDLDNDGDGIPDASDQCPNEAEDLDGFEDHDGCPDPDNDGDGIPDHLDKCPNEPEVFNGKDDDDGCPDEGRAVAVVSGNQIQIDQTIYFNTNKATLQRRSHKTLDIVVSVLKAHQALRVRVEGHTDDVGSDAYNMDLSQRRAESVRQYLIDQGIDESRLEAVGYGKTMPVSAGRTRSAREQNRRVEFVIIGRTDAP